MKQTNVKVPVEYLKKIELLVIKGRYKNKSHFIRQAIAHLLISLDFHAEPIIGFEEDTGI